VTFSCPILVEFVLSNCAKTSATDNNGNTLLHIAAAMNKAVNAYKLLDHGAALLARNSTGHTPIDVAATRQKTNSILPHKLGTMSHANARLSREVQDLKNFVMATAFFGNNLDRDGATSSATMTTTTTSQMHQDDPIQK
jgi:Ankyrin repeats (many copies)